MTTNQYVGHCGDYSPESLIIEDLTVESIKFNGCDLFYIPREILNEDYFYQEDILSEFVEKYPIEMYLQSVDGFEGDGDILSKFGLQIRDSADFVVAKRRFEEEITMNEANIKRPREGDLLYFPMTKGLFEIKFVEHENPFYQTGKLFSYLITVELFRYSSEDLNTGVEEIDSIQDIFENNDDASTDPFASNDEIEAESQDIIVDNADDTDPFGGF